MEKKDMMTMSQDEKEDFDRVGVEKEVQNNSLFRFLLRWMTLMK